METPEITSVPMVPPPSRRKATSFAALSKPDRRFLIAAAATIAIEEGRDYIEEAHKVAIQHSLVHIQSIEKQAVKQAVYRAVKTRMHMNELDLGDKDESIRDEIQEADKKNDGGFANNRLGKCGTKRKPLTMLVSVDKQRAAMAYKGATSHSDYRMAVKEAVITVASTAASTYRMAHDAASHLQQQGISVTSRHCYSLLKEFKETGRIRSPQKPGGFSSPATSRTRL